MPALFLDWRKYHCKSAQQEALGHQKRTRHPPGPELAAKAATTLKNLCQSAKSRAECPPKHWFVPNTVSPPLAELLEVAECCCPKPCQALLITTTGCLLSFARLFLWPLHSCQCPGQAELVTWSRAQFLLEVTPATVATSIHHLHRQLF